MDVIVLDGNNRSALAVTRALGKKGIRVIVGSEKHPSLASSSKYCREYFTYVNPSQDRELFFKSLDKHIEQHKGAMLLPLTDVTVEEILKHREHFRDRVTVPFVDHEEYSLASDKIHLLKMGHKLGIQVPKTLFSTDIINTEMLLEEASKLGFPVVLKKDRSRISCKNTWCKSEVCYAYDTESLKNLLANKFRENPFIIQEKIEGAGVGIFVLMNGKEVLASFAHRRLREKPPSGGVSVLCESIAPVSNAWDSAVKLLKALNWYGVAMVEFKLDAEDNVAKLIEINGRFWGSLQLAISSGVDFPFLLYSLATGGRICPIKTYKVGLKSRWELGDLDYTLIRLMKKSKDLSLPRDAPSRMRVLIDFALDFFRPSVKNEILTRDDPKPFFVELTQYIRHIIS